MHAQKIIYQLSKIIGGIVLYLLLVVVIGVLGLMLIAMQQKNKQLKDDKEMQLVQCAQCGIYIAKNEARIKNGAYHCRDCI